jgi:hypothetical protein
MNDAVASVHTHLVITCRTCPTTTQLTFRRSPGLKVFWAIDERSVVNGSVVRRCREGPLVPVGATDRDYSFLSRSVAPTGTIGLALVPVGVTNRD